MLWRTLVRPLQAWLPRRWRSPSPVPDRLWHFTLSQYPFLNRLDATEQRHLRKLCQHFLAEKEFYGAHGLVITDVIALSIAAQACLPLLHMNARDPLAALDWYRDFVGIVVQPGDVLAHRETIDPAGVVHRYTEVLAGEAMDRGPVMLNWQQVSQAAATAPQGFNLVIHEFAHKFDMRDMQAGGRPDGAPPLPRGFMGTRNQADARALWQNTMTHAWRRFREALAMAERFGAPQPWLDSYAAQDPAEFFAVTCEAYFVNRSRFSEEFPELVPLYDGFFRSGDDAPDHGTQVDFSA